jgi:plastocyanin
MKLFRTSLVLAMALTVLVTVAACSSSDDNNKTTAPTTKAAGSTSPAAASGATSVDVKAKDFSFDPNTFSVAAGKEVTIKVSNNGNITHTMKVYKDDKYTEPVSGADTSNISPGSTGQIKATFPAADYYFRCEVHPSQMQGEFEAK